MTTQFEQEVSQGQRFEFGKNWSRYQNSITEARIRIAEESFRNILMLPDLRGLSFLDVGSGSGLFSLVARRLGATVFSFDYDPNSVATTAATCRRFGENENSWHIEQGSILDDGYLKKIGQFDVVYSWGVLHHTGSMWQALANVSTLVKPKGRLYIALYNDQGWLSRMWWWVKRIYCSGTFGQVLVSIFFIPILALRALLKSIVTGRNEWTAYKNNNRGMSLWYDWIDWLGGFPFEVASVNAVKDFYEKRGFSLLKTVETKSWGNNEFVFIKD